MLRDLLSKLLVRQFNDILVRWKHVNSHSKQSRWFKTLEAVHLDIGSKHYDMGSNTNIGSIALKDIGRITSRHRKDQLFNAEVFSRFVSFLLKTRLVSVLSGERLRGRDRSMFGEDKRQGRAWCRKCKYTLTIFYEKYKNISLNDESEGIPFSKHFVYFPEVPYYSNIAQ